jgi:hypothetical protein
MQTFQKFLESKGIAEGLFSFLGGGKPRKLASGHPIPEGWGDNEVQIFNDAYKQAKNSGFQEREALSHAASEVESHMQNAATMSRYQLASRTAPNPEAGHLYGNAGLGGANQRPEGIRDGGSPRPLK